MTLFSPAPEVERVANAMIPVHHPHLGGVRIEYVFREKAAVSGGHTKWGTARKISGMAALLATPGAHDSAGLEFFVVEIARNVWDEIGPAQRKALVDHELSHCYVEINQETGLPNLVMRHHDLEEFSGVMRRHGMWKKDIADFLKAVGSTQLTLFTDTLDQVDIESFDPSDPNHSGAGSAPAPTAPPPGSGDLPDPVLAGAI